MKVTKIILMSGFIACSHLFAETVVDQYCIGLGLGELSADSRAQTFTVGISGTLKMVELDVFGQRFNHSSPWTFEIRETINGIPNDDDQALLASISGITGDIDWVAESPYHIFDISASNVQITDGDMLALVFQCPGEVLEIKRALSPYYDAGEGLIKKDGIWQRHVTDEDYHFVTHVEPIPEPTGLAYILLAGLCLYTRKIFR